MFSRHVARVIGRATRGKGKGVRKAFLAVDDKRD
jgi:hypothetical protein